MLTVSITKSDALYQTYVIEDAGGKLIGFIHKDDRLWCSSNDDAPLSERFMCHASLAKAKLYIREWFATSNTCRDCGDVRRDYELLNRQCAWCAKHANVA
jgi:hypothetical protein